MAVFESLIQTMIDAGSSYVFMWLLFAGIIYGLLEKYSVFGESSANGGVALGASFFTLLGIFQFAPEGLFLNFAAAIGFILFGIFGVLIILSISGIDVPEMSEGLEGNILAGSGILLILIAFLGVLAYQLDWSSLLGDVGNAWQDILFPIVFLVFMLIIILGAIDS